MAYKCEVCGMGVGSMTCAKCGKELVHDSITTDDGTTIYGNAGGAWTAFKSGGGDDEMSAPTLVDMRANVVHATTTSALSVSSVIGKPAWAISANILSLSTTFFGQPNETKPTVISCFFLSIKPKNIEKFALSPRKKETFLLIQW